MDHKNEKFEKQRVVLDGDTFTNCVFDECELIYAGGEPPRLIECRFPQATLRFEGAALRTTKVINMFAQKGSPLKASVMAAFPAVMVEDWRSAMPDDMEFATRRRDERRQWEAERAHR